MIDIETVRNKVIEFAIQGKISNQEDTDDSVQNLLDTIEYHPIDDIEIIDIPFEIPPHWKWIRLGDVCSAVTGRLDANQQDTKGEYPFFTCGVEVYKTLEYAFDCDAVLLGGNNASGDYKMHRYNGKFNAYQRVYVISDPPHEMLDYIFWVIKYWLPHLKYNSQGATTRFIKIAQVKGMLIPLPPFDEQKRIVKKIELIMENLNVLNELQGQYSSDLTILKSKIIDAGIQGKLTEQLPEDGTAEELLEQIAKEKKQLIKEKKIKASKALPEITEDEIPFEIPGNWKWVRWGDLSQSIQYGYNAPAKTAGRIKMVRISDIQDGKVLWDTVPYCDIDEKEIESYLLHENDILFARTGGTVGKSYIVTEIPEESVFAGYLIRTSYSSKLCARYMKYFMESNLYWRQLQNGTIATAQPNCNGQTLSKMILPLPPYAEQVRIVEKINAAMRAVENM